MPYIECRCGRKGNAVNGCCPICKLPVDYGELKAAAEIVEMECGCGYSGKTENTNRCPKCGSMGVVKFPIPIAAKEEKLLH